MGVAGTSLFVCSETGLGLPLLLIGAGSRRQVHRVLLGGPPDGLLHQDLHQGATTEPSLPSSDTHDREPTPQQGLRESEAALIHCPRANVVDPTLLHSPTDPKPNPKPSQWSQP